MKTCKYKKRLQFYLDGWMEDSEAARFERHLKKCPACQSELMELEDISSAALEIVDEAPERGYWDSFFTRALNRVTSRNITPYESPEESRKGLALKIGSYSLAIVSIAAVILLMIAYLPDVINRSSENDLIRQTAIETAEPLSIVSATDLVESPGSTVDRVTEPVESGENPEANGSKEIEPDLSSIQNSREESIDDYPRESEVLTYFRDDIITASPELVLSELPVLTPAPAKTEFDKINEDYRLSSSMISAGILSEVNDGRGNSGPLNREIELLESGNGFNGNVDGSTGNWGYLSMPPDSGNSEEFRRYLIELELIQTK